VKCPGGDKVQIIINEVPGLDICHKSYKCRIKQGFLILFCSLLACPSANALDPDRRISQYAHTAWRVADGVFAAAPTAITQTTDGYVWIGTLGGLLRFDGVRFVPWTPPTGEHLPATAVISLLGAAGGSL
jgi:ligand-binding sensor domain-containing protein